MVRQFWIYLLEDDEADLAAAIESTKPGSVVARGRFVSGGEPRSILEGALEGLTFRQLGTRSVERLYFHTQASQSLVAHPVEEGPLAGMQSIDASLSDCLHLVRPEPVRGMLEPSRLFGETHLIRGEKKQRKSPAFYLWLSGVHRVLKSAFPVTGVDFIHVGPRALAWVQSGKGQLSYLFQPVPLAPEPGATRTFTPQKRKA